MYSHANVSDTHVRRIIATVNVVFTMLHKDLELCGMFAKILVVISNSSYNNTAAVSAYIIH